MMVVGFAQNSLARDPIKKLSTVSFEIQVQKTQRLLQWADKNRFEPRRKK